MLSGFLTLNVLILASCWKKTLILWSLPFTFLYRVFCLITSKNLMDVRFKISQMIFFLSSTAQSLILSKNGATTKKDIDLTLRYNALEFDSEFCSILLHCPLCCLINFENGGCSLHLKT